MKPADVARAGGPSNQLISRLMQDDRDILDRRPDAETIRRYAVALRVREEDVLAAVAEAMGLPLTITTARLEDVPADALLNELRRRLTEAGETRGNTAPMNPKESSEPAATSAESALQGKNPQDSAESSTPGDRGDRTFDLSPTRACMHASRRGPTSRNFGHLGHQDDFDLAAHPPMPLAADKIDAEFDQLGEDNQDTDPA
ncbi:hypothetical protein [Micrococcus lylae]|uniref:hypothetical protein n=2 Tax=Micrococcus lylae TaxID=1273 RepID=UPI0014702CB8|nr:hypothetical protein [Micrococcus lylae]